MNAKPDPATIPVRAMRAGDVETCAAIAFEAHREVSARHGFTSEQPSREFSSRLLKMKFADPNAMGFVAEMEGAVAGSVFLNLFPGAEVAAIGPLTVAPHAAGGGRALMQRVLAEAEALSMAGVRLVQSPAHLQSLAMYVKAGFAVREPLVLVNDAPSATGARARARVASESDVPRCVALCHEVIGVSREHELRQAIAESTAVVVDGDAGPEGYVTGLGLRGHAVARTNQVMEVLIADAPRLPGPGFFLPTRNTGLLRSMLQGGARMQWPAHLMSRGAYEEPRGAYLPSIAF